MSGRHPGNSLRKEQGLKISTVWGQVPKPPCRNMSGEQE